MENQNIKMLGIAHLIGNILGGGLVGTILVVFYIFGKGNNITTEERNVCNNIINFNLSYYIYIFVSSILIILLIGFLTTPILVVMWLVFLIIGFVKHLSGENYEYPLTIKFLK